MLDQFAPNPRPDRAVTGPANAVASAGREKPTGRRGAGSDTAQAPDLMAGLDWFPSAASGAWDKSVGETKGGAWVALRPEVLTEAVAGGRPAGPLEDLRLAVKDLIAVEGLPLGAGTRVRSAAPAEPRDAEVVRRLRQAGALVVGTVALHELAFGVTGVNDQVGFPPHPVDNQRAPGGSSSGSAVAVADGSCDVALGTDTGGSCRIPAALCGVVGFKPARGSYPVDGVLALAPSLDHVGALARSVDVVARVHELLTGEQVELAGPPLAGLRLGLDRPGLDGAAPEVAAALDVALADLVAAGCELVEVGWPEPGEVQPLSKAIMWTEAAHVHRGLLDDPETFAQLGPDQVARFREGSQTAVEVYAGARVEAERLTVGVRALLEQVDGVIGPTVPVVAPTLDEARADPGLPGRLGDGTRLANVTGVPAVSVPLPRPGSAVGRSALPVGLMVQAGSNGATLALADVFMQSQVGSGKLSGR